MKICSKCKEEKNLDLFNRNKNSKDGRASACKACLKDYQDKYREANKENHKKWREANKESQKIYQKEKNRKWYEANRDVQRKKHKEYRKKTKEKKKKYLRKYFKERRKNDPSFRLSGSQRGIMKSALFSQGATKKKQYHELLGCSSGELQKHIEKQFQPWMNWENYGKYNGEYFFGWDVDHIRPISSFDLTDPEQQKKAFHYTNLQPLCSRMNRHDKRDLLHEDWIKLKETLPKFKESNR